MELLRVQRAITRAAQNCARTIGNRCGAADSSKTAQVSKPEELLRVQRAVTRAAQKCARTIGDRCGAADSSKTARVSKPVVGIFAHRVVDECDKERVARSPRATQKREEGRSPASAPQQAPEDGAVCLPERRHSTYLLREVSGPQCTQRRAPGPSTRAAAHGRGAVHKCRWVEWAGLSCQLRRAPPRRSARAWRSQCQGTPAAVPG